VFLHRTTWNECLQGTKRAGTVPLDLENTPQLGPENYPQDRGTRPRAGDSAVTIEGGNLWPLFEDFQAKLCEEVRESDLAQAKVLAVMYIETITVRLWL
jgi:hypothetical protein